MKTVGAVPAVLEYNLNWQWPDKNLPFSYPEFNKSELVFNQEIWNLSLPITDDLKKFGIDYTEDLQNYNNFSFKNLP
jgi:hypothetical protein